jgi:hypothetical protein
MSAAFVLVARVVHGMFLIRSISLSNCDLSSEECRTLINHLENTFPTRKEPVEATLVLAADANEPILG